MLQNRNVLILLLCMGVSACNLQPETDDEAVRQLTVLYTNDEHGWMQGMEAGQGAANLLQLWRTREGFTADGPFLVLSGGDNWTGPAISTWTEGESMVAVMNAMKYDASAVGNHEFDFGLDSLRQRIVEADFPYLSANTLRRSDGQVATDLGLLPFSMQQVNDLQVAIIGLTTTDTPGSTNPVNVASLRFEDYEVALRRTVPQVREQDPDLLFVISHVCLAELKTLIESTRDLQLDLVGAGHCNELTAENLQGTILLGGGYHFTSYAAATFSYDLDREMIMDVSYRTETNEGAQGDAQLETLIAQWSTAIESSLSEVVAYSAQEEARSDGRLNQAIVDSWLWHDSSADIAITNAGGIRIDLPEGPVDLNTLVAMMPFDNTIVALQLDGATIESVLETGSRPLVAGLTQAINGWVLDSDGQKLDPDTEYRVLVNSFMYAGGDGYDILSEADPAGFDTGIHYRQPFVEWLRSRQSSAASPLELRNY